MLLKIDQLEVGDEVLCASGSNLRYLRILRKPTLRKNLNWKNQVYYKTIKCSFHTIKIVNNYNGRSFTKIENVCTPDEHNTIRYFDLNEKELWLIKKNDI